MPWLPMPLGNAMIVWLLGALLPKYMGRSWSLVGCMLISTSPIFYLLGASYMSHTTWLMFMLITAYCAQIIGRSSSTPQRKRALAWGLGLSIGCAIITRPQDTLMLLPGFLLACYFNKQTHPCSRRLIMHICTACCMPLCFLFVWQYALYENPFSTGYNFGSAPSLTPTILDRFGFHSHYTWRHAFHRVSSNLYRLDRVLLGWPITLPLLALCFFQYRQKKPKCLI